MCERAATLLEHGKHGADVTQGVEQCNRQKGHKVGEGDPGNLAQPKHPERNCISQAHPELSSSHGPGTSDYLAVS